MNLEHWSGFVAYAVMHAEAMKYTQIAIDPMQIVAAMQQAQRQQSVFHDLRGNGPGIGHASGAFDPRLITAR